MVQFSSLYTARLDEELGTDDSTTLFTTARRKSAVNRGVEQFAELTECFLRWSTVTIIGGTAEYNMNAAAQVTDQDFIRLAQTPIEFKYTVGGVETILSGQDHLPHRDLKWLDDNEPGWRLSTVAATVKQLPTMTYVRVENAGYFLGFWPPPSTGAGASASALVPYVAKPPLITVDTVEPYTVSGAVRLELRTWHQAVVHFAAHQLEKLRRDTDASQAQLQMFLGYVQRYLQNTRKKGGHSITLARHYFIRGGRLRQTDRPRDPRT